MFNIKRIGAGVTLWAALSLFTQSALALGLGNISVESYLNQPLRARIDLIVRADDDLGLATVGMASADDYALIGASREAISVPLRFDFEQDEAGAGILVTSEQVVKDPIIRLIVEVKWAKGRLLREYTLFLDPPSFSAPAPSPPVVDERGRTPVSPPPETAEWVPSDAAAQPESSAGRSRLSQSASAAGAGNEYGPVRSGDTLWRIAVDWSQGSRQDLNSVMLAIQRNNPHAFIHDNVNLLKQGVILRMPQPDEVRQISADSARAEVVQQNRAFSQERAAPAMETPLLDANSRPAPGAAADMSDAESRDQLELVPPADKADVSSANGFEQSPADSQASTGVEAVRAELARKEEELIVEQQQNQYLQEQISELQGQLQSAQEGNVADAGLAQMEAQLKEERLAGDDERGGELQPTGPAPAAQAGRAAVPEVITSAKAEPEKSWYSSKMLWLLVLAVGAAGWFINRRNSGQTMGPDMPAHPGETVREMQDEAEEILQVLKTDKKAAAEEPSEAAANEEAPAKEPKPRTIADRRARPSEEAELLDEDSADPEVRLDLARAYISMGDREAARVILDEVVEHGTEEQQAEARKMLGQL